MLKVNKTPELEENLLVFSSIFIIIIVVIIIIINFILIWHKKP